MGSSHGPMSRDRVGSFFSFPAQRAALDHPRNTTGSQKEFRRISKLEIATEQKGFLGEDL